VAVLRDDVVHLFVCLFVCRPKIGRMPRSGRLGQIAAATNGITYFLLREPSPRPVTFMLAPAAITTGVPYVSFP